MAAAEGEETKRILLVDDEEALVWSLSTRLRKARRYQIDAAHEGETALKKLSASKVDLLVADVRMPGMSGIDLILTARAKMPNLPVIVMTAFKTPDVQRLSGGSAIDFLDKPFAFERFLEMVDDALTEKQTGFHGAISVQSLPDVVQLYVLSNATGILSVKHQSGEGSLWFDQGRILHAVTRDKEGEPAFFDIMMWSGGEFSTRVGAIPARRSITGNWQELLMESCRRIDEKRRGDTQPASSARSGWTLAPPPLPDDSDPFADLEILDEPPAISPRHVALPTLTEATETQLHSEEKMNVKDSLGRLNQIDGFVGAALVDSESGMLLGQEGGQGLNLEIAAAGNTEVVKAKRKTMNNLQLKDQVEDILITLGKQYHMIRPLRTRSTLFFYVALDRQRANLAMARIALADVEKDLVV